MSSFTHRHITSDVEDKAPGFGLGDMGEMRFAKDDLDAEATGVSHQKLNPLKRSPFGHKHEKAEEVYVVISGSGRMKLDDEIIDLKTLDAVRVAPSVIRAFEAGAEGMEVLAVGPRMDGDGEMVQGWWSD